MITFGHASPNESGQPIRDCLDMWSKFLAADRQAPVPEEEATWLHFKDQEGKEWKVRSDRLRCISMEDSSGRTLGPEADIFTFEVSFEAKNGQR